MIEARFPGSRRGRLFDREKAEDELFNALAVILDQIDYTNQACSPAEAVGAVLDHVLIERARQAMRKFKQSRGELVPPPFLTIPE
jgi:hypothetical protein